MHNTWKSGNSVFAFCSRWSGILILGICLTLLSAGLPAGTAASGADSKQPNILFLLIDDMGWPDLACYGSRFNESPSIDRLCAQGMKFTDFYAATPVCSSTRCTIQSGQYSARVGITDFIPGHFRPFEKLIVPEIENELPQGIRTPGDQLLAAGYATAYFGKWHLGPEPKRGPETCGYTITARTIDAEFRKSRRGRSAGPKQIDLLTDQTMHFIRQNKNHPFFVTLSHHAVHIPLQSEDASIRKYRQKAKPSSGVNNPVYAGMIEDLDRSVQRILDLLDELKLSQNTIVVFTSDNGGLQKIYTGVGEVVSTNAPLRDEKGTLYEGGVRVPMFVRWPGVVEPNSVCHEPTTTADLLSTFCEMSGASLPDQPIDGLSLVSLLRDSTHHLNREAIYFHYPHYHHSRPNGAIRVGDWKLIEFFDDGSLELYNLKDDLGEAHDLAAAQPERARTLQKKLVSWRKQVGARMPQPNPKYDAARAAQWWSRRTNQPLDIKAMAERYKSKQ